LVTETGFIGFVDFVGYGARIVALCAFILSSGVNLFYLLEEQPLIARTESRGQWAEE
jgi:hypothetical protein